MTPLLVGALVSLGFRWETPRPCPGPKGGLVLSDGRILIAQTRPSEGGTAIFVSESRDEGATWRTLGKVAEDPEPHTDMGDGNLVREADGRLLYGYRQNHARGTHAGAPTYSVRVAESADGGLHWRAHSVVESIAPKGAGPSRGLWAPFLFVTSDGTLQCYYDDERTPWARGFSGHQWVQMKRYDPKVGRWTDPVTVARAHDPKDLSRDGMAVVVETAPGKLLCAFESVQTTAPHAGLVRMVTSDDGGRTWSWTRRERAVLYQPKDPRYHAFCPWLLRLDGKNLICALATNEDRAEPGVSGTPADRLMLDVKTVESHDDGRTWDARASLLYGGTHRNYLPSLLRLPAKPEKETRLLATFLDFDRGDLGTVGVESRP